MAMLKMMMLLLSMATVSGSLTEQTYINGNVKGKHNLKDEVGHLKLPYLSEMMVDFGYAQFWFMNNDKTAEKQLNDCGVRYLFDALMGTDEQTSIQHLPKTPSTHLFTSRVDTLCEKYRSFQRCCEYKLKSEQVFVDKVVVDAFYQYSCHEGYANLCKSGQCLVGMDIPDFGRAECQDINEDLSQTIQIMIAMYHSHPDNSNNTNTLVKYLGVLCKQWYKFEKCYLPMFAEQCGDSSRVYFKGLMESLKTILQSIYKDKGPKIVTAARCEETKDTHIVRSDGDAYTEMMAYRKSYTQAVEYWGPCAPVSLMYHLQCCFWKSMVRLGNPNVMFADIFRHRKEICQLSGSFLKCYHGDLNVNENNSGVDKCMNPDDVINLDGIFHHICDFFNITEHHRYCIPAVSKITSGKCGYSIPGLITRCVYQTAVVYNKAREYHCNDSMNVTVPSFGASSCVRRVLKNKETLDLDPHTISCVDKLAPSLGSFLDSFDDVLIKTGRFFDRVFEQDC